MHLVPVAAGLISCVLLQSVWSMQEKKIQNWVRLLRGKDVRLFQKLPVNHYVDFKRSFCKKK